MGLSNLLNLSSKSIIGVDDFLEKKPDGIITVTGYEYKMCKGDGGQPDRKVVYHIKELGGVKLWASGSIMKKQMPEEFIDEYGSDAAANENLKKSPMRFKVHPIVTLANRRKFRPIDCLGFEEDGNEVS